MPFDRLRVKVTFHSIAYKACNADANELHDGSCGGS